MYSIHYNQTARCDGILAKHLKRISDVGAIPCSVGDIINFYDHVSNGVHVEELLLLSERLVGEIDNSLGIRKSVKKHIQLLMEVCLPLFEGFPQ